MSICTLFIYGSERPDEIFGCMKSICKVKSCVQIRTTLQCYIVALNNALLALHTDY